VRRGRETEICGMTGSLLHATNHVGKLWHRGRVEAERIFQLLIALFPLFKYLLLKPVGAGLPDLSSDTLSCKSVMCLRISSRSCKQV